MSVRKAEIISIGDELVSGQRLDTNSQWLSNRLGELGIEPSFHTCVGDNQDDGIHVFQTAIGRAEIVISTGGIGPTKDDLTREVLASAAGVALEFHEEVEQKIKAIFAGYGREMPANNTVQAYFPAGSNIISNTEGTAPGIDIMIRGSRVFALPGVPYEMKQMWEEYVLKQVAEDSDEPKTLRHHVIHCFGAGESQVETQLQGLTQRGAIPRVGISASQATISLRITTIGNSDLECNQLLVPTIATIKERLGNLIFGENGVELQQVVIDLLGLRGQTIALVDFGFGGAAGGALLAADTMSTIVKGSTAMPHSQSGRFGSLGDAAQAIRTEFAADIGVAISAVRTEHAGERQVTRIYDLAIADASHVENSLLHYGGHSGLRDSRTAKQILNQVRLHLLA